MRIGISVMVVASGLAFGALARDVVQPAELPPASYAGQQYVDSRGCAFLRAGAAGKTSWIPRVTRDGVPVCGYPPSGNRVAAVGEAGVSKVAPKAAAAVAAPTGVTGPLTVAVGTFSVVANADRAARSMADIGLPVLRGQITRSGVPLEVVYAGPFATTAAAAAALASVRAAGFPDAVILRQ